MTDRSPVPLTSVHDALNRAVFEDRHQGEPTSFRVDSEIKARAHHLCEAHGTRLSSFLRQCVIGLVRDYETPQNTE